MKKKTIFAGAFTLIELIVVVTILSILGTIAFVSLQGFAKDARDSTRISDITTIKKSLSLFVTQVGSYPLPDQDVPITYSGGLVWTQGIFGEGLTKKLRNISETPRDPLTDDFYSYSVLNSGTEFQVAGVLEGDLAYSPFIDSAYATGKIGKSYVSGNYNGKLAKTSLGPTTYILAIPTIISGDISLTDIETLVASQKLVYNNGNTIPASFEGTDFDTSQTLDYTPPELVVFSGDIENLDEINSQIDMIEKIQAAYSSFNFASDDDILKKIVESQIDPTDPSTEVKNLAHSIIANVVSYDAKDYTNIANTPTGPCGITSQDIIDLNTLFDYPGSIYQFSTAQEWCDLTTISADNRSLSRLLSPALGKLENLSSLSMRNNALTGSIPDGIGNMSDLEYLSLYGNSLSGSIPESFSNLTSLETLKLYANNLTGELPLNIGNMTSLERLEIQRNGLTGTIPTSIENMVNLRLITLQNNQLSGTIPPGIGNISPLYWINLSSNNLSGAIPSTMGNLSLLQRLYLFTNDFDELPDSLVNLTQLVTLELTNNPQLGNISQAFGKDTGAQSQANITDSGKEMTISGNGTTIDIVVN